MKIVCSGHLIRYPLGGFVWHHMQYLIGFSRMGHEVTFFEDSGWPSSCFDPGKDEVTSDPTYGIGVLHKLFERFHLDIDWCYLAEDGVAHGMSRDCLALKLREADVYFNLSNINWIPEIMLCRRRALVDTDPVFTQIGAHGMSPSLSAYQVLFTYGENVHRSESTMPTGGARWVPTRQPVVLPLWPVPTSNPFGPFTTIMNWSALGGDFVFEGESYGQKDREFEPYALLPQFAGAPLEVAVSGIPDRTRQELVTAGWTVTDPLVAAHSVDAYQAFIARSRAEFSVAKHGYVTTQCGWFSDRSTAYLAMGRPVVLQDTGFSRYLPCGAGLLPFRTPDEAIAAIGKLSADRYPGHCAAARSLVDEHFNADHVLQSLLERAL